jgi:hypothetical protein
MIEGIDRGLWGLLTFLASWLGGTIRIKKWRHVVYPQCVPGMIAGIRPLR